ncbi:MAG: zinc ribbon domain-containing protein [Promethearchaeota archaeon]
MERPPIILADWDEDEGPIIVDSIFEPFTGNMDDNPEVLVTRCYISAQSIFAREKFTKINFNLPMVPIKKLAIVFFDVFPDESVRGGNRPFILVIFTPLNIKYGIIDNMVSIVEPYLDQYKKGIKPDLLELQVKIENLIENMPEESGKEPSGQHDPGNVPPAMPTMKKLSLQLVQCPRCGYTVYPEEVSCTNCRFLIRSFCAKCNNLVLRSSKFCDKCGAVNEKYDPNVNITMIDHVSGNSGPESLSLEDQVEMEFQREMQNIYFSNENNDSEKNAPNEVKLEIEKEFDIQNKSIASEINRLKESFSKNKVTDKKLELNDHLLNQALNEGKEDRKRKDIIKNLLVDSFTRDYEGFRRGTKNLPDQSMQKMLDEPAVDEIHLLIKSMNFGEKINEPKSSGGQLQDVTDLEIKARTRPEPEPEHLLMEWNTTAFLRSKSKVLIGFGTNITKGKGIPGTLFICESTLIFFSYNELIAGVQGVFSYFDADLTSLFSWNFSPEPEQNLVVFTPHGFLKEQVPGAENIFLHFSWGANGSSQEEFEKKSLMLKSSIQRAQLYPRRPPITAGKFVFLVSKMPTDPFIKNIIGTLQLHFPPVVQVILKRYPMLR